jgi:predicted alpha/beta-fold hydrolase
VGDPELKWLIGQSFRQNLADVVFTGQQVQDRNVLKIHADEYHMNARESEAAGISFVQYLNKLVLPSLGNADTKALFAASSLYSLAGLLKSNSHIFVMENEDDIIIHQGDIDFLKANLGDRLLMYPQGGHIGNLGFPKNLQDFAEIMAKPSY